MSALRQGKVKEKRSYRKQQRKLLTLQRYTAVDLINNADGLFGEDDTETNKFDNMVNRMAERKRGPERKEQ